MPFKILVEGKTPKGEDAALEYSWVTGEEKPTPDKEPFWLEASNKELDDLRLQFENIPIIRRGHAYKCQWTGEMAVFIFDNL